MQDIGHIAGQYAEWYYGWLPNAATKDHVNFGPMTQEEYAIAFGESAASDTLIYLKENEEALHRLAKELVNCKVMSGPHVVRVVNGV